MENLNIVIFLYLCFFMYRLLRETVWALHVRWMTRKLSTKPMTFSINGSMEQLGNYIHT